MIKKPSIYDDMKELHRVVAPLRMGVIRNRERKAHGRMNKAIQECIKVMDAFTSLANSVSGAVVAVTSAISASKEKNKNAQ